VPCRSDEKEEEEEEEELMEVEREARELDREQAEADEEAEEELQLAAMESERFSFQDSEALTPAAVKERIGAVLEILMDFANKREADRPRSDYLRVLKKDLSEHFGYIPDLAEMFLSIFPPQECVEFMEASDKPRPIVIRANTLKARRKDLAKALMTRGVNLEPLGHWTKVGLKIIDSQVRSRPECPPIPSLSWCAELDRRGPQVPVGATPEYLAGHYMLQSAASMNPVMALQPQPNEKVLDMSAAPGGKCSYMAQVSLAGSWGA
jgi:25S rRNA (cytosine2870-C5)-methyltransferase